MIQSIIIHHILQKVNAFYIVKAVYYYYMLTLITEGVFSSKNL